jgi:TonB-linked SusC/RagA family outer membrane protein
MNLRTWCIRIGQILTKTLMVFTGTLFSLIISSQVHAKNDTDGITINQQNVPLEKVFEAIQRQSDYTFIYRNDEIDGLSKVTLNLRNASLQQALDACFRNQPLTYNIYNSSKTIVIKRKPAQIASTVSNVLSAPGKIIAVRGRVISNNAPIAGATVTIKGSDYGTTTDKDGIFALAEVEETSTLIISHISLQGKEIKLNGQSFITVHLDPKVNDLDEAVVVAYNTTTRRMNTAAVSVVKGEEVQSIPNRSVDKSLQGLVPGLLVTSGTGQPGGGVSNFVLRGIATGGNPSAISTVRNPLIVVDGVPVTQDFTPWSNYSLNDAPVMNPMAQLNPADIESITVLKDAAAIALYGSKASNGVILITTKRGKPGKAKFAFNHQTDISSRLKGKIELLNQQEYLDLLYETYKNTNAALWTDSAITADLKTKFPTQSDGSFYSMTDWQNEIYTNHALTVSNNLSISGANEKSNYFLNFEYTKQNGLFKKTGYDRKSVRFNFENKPLNWLRLGVNSTLSYNIQDYASIEGGTFPLGIAMYFSPMNPVRYEDGNLVLNYTFPYQVANPLAAIEFNKKRNTGYRALSKLYGELSLLKNFKFTSSLGVDLMLVESKEKIDPRLFDYPNKAFGGRIQEMDTRNANLITTNMLKYDKQLKKDHAVNVLLGQEAQILTNRSMMLSVGNLRVPDYDQLNNGATVLERQGSSTKQTLLSYFGQANYVYKDKYFFMASIRQDGSSLFGERNRFGTYWSTGVGWLLTGEPFMKKTSSWLDYFKIRGSIGAAGNAATISRLARFNLLQIGTFLNNNAVFASATGNPSIKWEETFTWDAGVEARFLRDRITLTADIYNRKTKDLVYLISLPPVTGYSSVSDNIGDMKNHGVELSISAVIIKNRHFQWKVNTNWSTNKNILVKANIPLSTVGTTVLANEEGRNFNSFYLVKWAGVNAENGSPQWIDSTGAENTKFSAAKRIFVGKPQPDAFGAFTNTFSFKNIELSALFYYQYGFQIYNSYALTGRDGFLPFDNSAKSALDYWKKPGDVAANPKRTLNNTNGVFNQSTRHLYNGDFIRLQTLTVSYLVPQKIVERLHLSMVKLYAQGYNLALWTSFPGQDPADVNVAGSVDVTYPNQKSYSVGLNVNF